MKNYPTATREDFADIGYCADSLTDDVLTEISEDIKLYTEQRVRFEFNPNLSEEKRDIFYAAWWSELEECAEELNLPIM